MNLIWGFPGYWATVEGRIWSFRRYADGRVLKTTVNGSGYRRVILQREGEQVTQGVHSLVALAFLGPRPDGQEVRHLDGDQLNNHVGNLKYGTRSENMLDRVRHGTHHGTRKTHCPQGHEYTAENTYVWAGRPNQRHCRQCSRSRAKAWAAVRRRHE